MRKKLWWLFVLPAFLLPFVFSCSDTPSPFTASNASISMMMENSKSIRNADSLSDTVGKVVKIGLAPYLSKYINSVTVSIAKGVGDTDTTFTFLAPSTWTDTAWFSITLNSAGTRTVTASAAIQGEPNYSLTAKIVIYARPSTITYDGNGSTGGKAPVDPTYYPLGASVTVKANVGALVRTGYTFAGWNTAANGTGASYAGGETFVMGATNATLYAKWTQNPTYSVVYSGNGNTGGTAPTDSNAYEQSANVTVLANTGSLTKTSFTFAGWNTSADGKGTTYAGGETFKIATANDTLFAVWTQNATYTVTYNGNGSTAGTVPSDANAYEQGASVNVKANTGNLARTGYTFAGWNAAADGTGASYSAGTSFNIGTANVTLYAVWTQNPTYTVTYSGNSNTSGAAPTDANAYQQGASVTVKANTGNLARTGYTFAGWNTAADGSGTTYAAGSNLTMGSSNTTLYAVWTQNPTFTVTYNGNTNTSGTAPTDANAYQQGASVTVKSNTGNLAKTGYTFAGWNTAADGSGTPHAGGETFNIGAANVTLYAVWTQNPTYTVIYSGNNSTGGAVPVDGNMYEQGASVTVKANTGNLVRTGYTFAGWNTAADGSGTSYAAAGTFTMGAANVILYAKWTQNPTYTVTYNGNNNTSGTAPTDQNAYLQGATVTVIANTGNLAKTGFTFAGWNTAADGSGTSYAAAATFSIGNSNVTLYAKWMAVYTVTYFGNNSTLGLPPVDSKLYASGETVTVLDNTGTNPLTRTGWTFATKWNTNAAGTGIDYIPGTQFTITANVNMYAKWTATVTFDGQGATAQPDPQSITITTPTITLGTLPPAPTKTSYIFGGWYTQPNGGGSPITGTTQINQGMTVYAYWQIKDIDGNVYTEVKIGNQVWMVQNLKTTKLNDGTALINDTSFSQWGYGLNCCWVNSNIANKDPYGALYIWDVVNTGKLAPDGWRVANDDDWNALATFLGDSAGGKMKATGNAYWFDPNQGATNSSGFTAVGAGEFGATPLEDFWGFQNWKAVSKWWGSTDLGRFASCYVITSSDAAFSTSQNDQKINGLSVRCVRTW
jgi:uncharacterized protein (TIGR02145 family)/uncharacterized repeat protein (TIGR02543 family)